MEAPDEQLMLAYRDGNAAAFETLYLRHRGRLFRFVLRSVKSRATGEELFQEIWMRVIEARARYTPQARFTTWLYTIAHNHLVDHWRKRGLTLVSLEGDETPGASPDPADHAAARESLARFAAAAVLVFAVALTMHIERQQPDPEAAAPPQAPAPRAETRGVITAKPADEASAKPAPEAAPPAARAEPPRAPAFAPDPQSPAAA